MRPRTGTRPALAIDHRDVVDGDANLLDRGKLTIPPVFESHHPFLAIHDETAIPGIERDQSGCSTSQAPLAHPAAPLGVQI